MVAELKPMPVHNGVVDDRKDIVNIHVKVVAGDDDMLRQPVARCAIFATIS